jgi:hypothetical protein
MLLVSSEERTMAVYQYVNAEREVALVVLSGDKVDEVPPSDLTFCVASPGDEMEAYVNDPANGPRRLIESGKVGKLASRVRLV